MESNVTVIVALITAITAMVSPIITSIVTSKAAYKLKTAELFYTSKVKAFNHFIETAASFRFNNSTTDDILQLQNASLQAMLFSSNETRTQLAIYGKTLMDIYESAKNGSVELAKVTKLNEAQYATIKAMQIDLKK